VPLLLLWPALTPPRPLPRPQAHRGPCLAVGAAAGLLLAVAALRRVVAAAAVRAEERVMRQLELQKRAEELAGVRNVGAAPRRAAPPLARWARRAATACIPAALFTAPASRPPPAPSAPQRIRGALDASEPDRDSRQIRAAALARDAEAADRAAADAGAAAAGGPAAPAAARPRGGPFRPRRGARAGAAAGEDEAVRRFQAFVRSSGMSDVMAAGDGRMWDIARAEGPQVRGV
jgi:hypothetical protein